MVTAMALGLAARRYLPGNSPGALRMQMRFVLAGLAERALVNRMMSAKDGSALHQIMVERPQLLGALVWPYQCAAWGVPERLHRIISHYSAVDELGAPFRFSIHERLVLARLDSLHEGMMVVLDQPEWFLREGGLAMSLFMGSFRAYSIAFSLSRAADGGLTATIGGVQGRSQEDALDTYRVLTKELHGLRPRDFLIETFRILCRQLGVRYICAVSESARHQRHPFFQGAVPVSHNYDAIWEDRGGMRAGPNFYALPVTKERRDLSEVKSGKRSMYRRRFDFLDWLEADIAKCLPGLRPVRFADS